tara:strand:- start:8162 stop:10687 length:2526 start_codon:yes stop_codon:yes gene_type:complete
MALYDFTGANGDPLPAGLTAAAGTFEINNNKLFATGSNPGGLGWLVTQQSAADATIQATYNAEGDSSASLEGVVFRLTDNANFLIAGISASTGEFAIYAAQSGAFNKLTQINIPSFSTTTDYTIKVVMSGQDIVATVNDANRLTRTAAFNETATQHGLRYASVNKSFDDLSIPRGVITPSITSYETWQRNTSDQALVEFNVDYEGSATTIERQLNGGAWSVVVASPAASGTYNESLTLDTGHHTIAYRFSNDVTGTLVTLDYVTVGDVFVLAGQSQMRSQGENFQTYNRSTNGTRAVLLGNDDVWKEASDPIDDNTNQVDDVSNDELLGRDPAGGSWMMRFCDNWLSEHDVPIAMIMCALGGTSQSDWQKTSSTTYNGINLYQSMTRRIGIAHGCRMVFFQQGELDASIGTSSSQYQALYNALIDDIKADFDLDTLIIPLGDIDAAGYDPTDVATIRAAQILVAQNNNNAEITDPLTGIPVSLTDGIHFETDAALQAVADVVYNSYSTLFDIELAPAATGPIASAGPDQSVAAGVTVTLDFTGSTAGDAAIVSYALAQDSGDTVTVDSSTPTAPTFTAPSTNSAQNLTFTLTVTDANGLTDTDALTVSVAAQLAPTASAGQDQSVAAGATVTLDATASTDSDGSVISYAWAQTAGGDVVLSDSSAPQPTFTAPASDTAQTLTFTVTVTDDNGATASDTVSITVDAMAQGTEKINNMADNGYTLKGAPTVTAYLGRSNLTLLQFAVETQGDNTALTGAGLLDFTSDVNQITRVDIVMNGAILSSTGGDVLLDNQYLKVRFGAFNLAAGAYYPQVIIYVASDTRGIVICGPGLPAVLRVDYRA